MPDINLEARYARQVFLKYAPPLQAVPIPSAQSIANQALQRQSGSSAQGLGSFVAKTARPDTRVMGGLPFNATRGGALALRPAQAAAQVAARRTATQILMSRASLSGAKELTGLALQPAVRASAAVGGAISRTPVIGPAVRVVSRFVPKGPVLGVLTAVTVIPDVLELFAPDVKSWLLGGWRQSGRKGTQLPPGVGQSAVLYNLQFRVAELYNGELYPPDGSPDQALSVMGPIGSVLAPREPGGGLNVSVLSPTNALIGGSSKLYGDAVYRIVSVTISRVDGVPESGAPFVISGGTAKPARSGTRSGVNSPARTDTAQRARDAALLAAIATIAAGKYRIPPKFNNNPTQNPARKVGLLPSASPTQPVPSTQPCKGNSCGQAGLDQATKNGQDLQTILDLLNALGIGDIKKTVDRIDTKIGPQITDAVGNKRGLTEVAMDTVRGVGKIKDYLPIDRALNLLTLATTIHNAAMLSQSLEQTLASTVSNVLAALGIKDTDGNPFDINKILSDSVSGFLKSVLGADNYTSLVATWKKGNRIYQASANLLSNVNSLRYSFTSALEQIGGMNGKIGNALRKSGAVSENSYPWFNPSPNYDNRFMRGLETAEQFTSSIDSIAGEILSAQESIVQIGAQKTELETALKSGTEKPAVENDQQKDKAAAAKTVSVSPNIEPTDLAKPGGT